MRRTQITSFPGRHQFVRASPVIFDTARAVEAFDRPAWLYRARGRIPAREVCFREPRAVTEADVQLSQRLLTAYALAGSDAPDYGGMWSTQAFQHTQRELAITLQRRDPTALAQLLASMFRSDFVLGLAPGSLGLGRTPRKMARLPWLTTLSKLVSLAEWQGVTRVENPEQGAAGIGLEDGIDRLTHGIEAALGVSLDFPEVGAAYGLRAAGRLIAPDTPDHVYAASRLRDVIITLCPSPNQRHRIVEIGGGYGSMAYWLPALLDPPPAYVIIDLPLVNVLQGYFLSQALGHSEVSLYGEQRRRISVLPGHALSEVETPFEVLVNKDSMPEISRETLLGYLTWARSSCEGIFYSYNQEAAAVFAGTPQIVVPEILKELGGYARIRREVSWLRRGYVEEVYRVGGTPSSVGYASQ